MENWILWQYMFLHDLTWICFVKTKKNILLVKKTNISVNFERNRKAYWALHTVNNDPKQCHKRQKIGFYAKNDPTWSYLSELFVCIGKNIWLPTNWMLVQHSSLDAMEVIVKRENFEVKLPTTMWGGWCAPQKQFFRIFSF